MMKSGYNNTIHEGGELKPLTNASAGIPETGGSRIMKKHMVLVSFGLVIMVFLIGHLTTTHHSGLRMSQESMTAQLVDSKELVDSKKEVSPSMDIIALNEGGNYHSYGYRNRTSTSIYKELLLKLMSFLRLSNCPLPLVFS